MKRLTAILTTTASFLLGAGSLAAEPALIFDLGGKFDKSFNEAAFTGAQRWVKETGGTYKELEVQSATQRVQFARRMAESGANPVVVMGFQNEATLQEVAPDYPDTRFVLIDAVVDLPNVRSVIFAEQEGSYLTGMLAALASKTGTVSFIGGMDIPLISAFGCGFAQGAKAVNPDVKILVNYTGDTPAAWNDPVKGAEIAKAQMSQGSDVIFAAAGGTGLGVLQAAADAGIFGIGVDSNQNHLHPGKVLTSMLKLVDNAVEQAFKDGPELTPGVVRMDLAAGGVDYARDDNNKDLITPEMTEKVEAARAAITSGEIKVHDYRTDSSCPAF